ncbi:hypothetical protein EDB87DRAFT_1578446 [Lactarius vividus]|nr:hypothetical protein EDB87DRAFT_1578446 [Lactarius vividus]
MSFISVEPQSRVFLESHSNSLLSQFDIQLEIIADRYLAFFQERLVNVIRDFMRYANRSIFRRRIEVTYIDSLRKLHRKATIVDTSFDPRAESTTTRAAWDKVRDNLEGEADAQQAFVDILDNDVIKPLTNLKASQELLVLAEIPVLIIGYLKGNRRSDKEASRERSRGIRRKICRPRREHNFEAPAGILEEISSSGVPNKRIGGKGSALFRDRQEDTPISTPVRELDPSKSEEVFDDDCRRAVGFLNTLRLKRVESLDDAYDCLAALVFTPTVKNVLVKYMDGMTAACTKHVNLAMSISAEALTGTDASGLRASFNHALSISIPPLTLYCNYRPDVYSDLIFGVPLVNLATNQDYVPRVIRMCIEEVEKRGLNTHKIYLKYYRPVVFAPTIDLLADVNSLPVAAQLYLWDLPKPLIMLSLEDCRKYRQNRARYAENDHSMLRSKIRELHPVHRASLEAVLQHLLFVASHSDKNAMAVEALAAQFCYTVLRGNAVLEGSLIPSKKLVMEDLIQNAHTLFDERPPQFSSSQSDSAVEGRLTPLLGLSLSQVPKEDVETTTQEEVIPRARGAQAVETLLNGSPPEAASLPPASAPEWWLPHPGIHQYPEAPTIPPSRPESVLSNTSDISLSAASLLSSTTEFPSSPAASLLSSTTESPLSPAASLRSSTTGAVFSAIRETF